MLKKSIIGLLLLVIAMPAFAGDDVEKKVEVNAWPVVYKFLPACTTVKVIMNLGYYVKIEKCKKLKIKLKQKSIEDYEGCTDFKIMSNFDLELGAAVNVTAAGLQIADAGNWSAFIDGDNFVNATTSFVKRTICVKVKKAKIINASPDKELHVANASILIRPIASP